MAAGLERMLQPYWALLDAGSAARLLAALCLAWGLWKAVAVYFQTRAQFQAFKAFPGPSRHWLYGNMHEFKQDGKDLDKVISWAEQYPFGHTLWFGNFLPMLFITHPDYAKTLLGRGDPKAWTYNFLTPWIGNGLLILNGKKWFQHRKLLTPAFHYDILKPYVKLMSDSTKVMLDKWEKLITKDNKTVELFEHVSLMALDSIMKCAFSCESNCQTDSKNAYVQSVYDLAYLSDHRFRWFPLHNDVIYHLSPYGYRFRKACKIAHQHTDNVIKQRKELLKNGKELEKIKEKRHLDFLDILLCSKDENGEGLSDTDLRAEVDTFMFEGHDTTSSGIPWILYNMAKYPEHQEKCREEIRGILGDRNTIEWNDLSMMNYTTMCVKESLRLYPPVPLVSRELTSPIKFCDGRSLPKGSVISVSISAIHRDPKIWEDPEVFDPVRFSPDNSSHRHSHAFLPFIAGQRNCIGQTFAMNEMKVAVALTLLRFELSLSTMDPPLVLPQLVLRSKNGIHVNLKKLKEKL
ncbi:cytochrome P450 4B1-like [Ambystoma mexicanum]|uniref:cytochrome P450 4B1-like n=1 Tax=Ambystoma mexicanum TaxID=8296 RepID=UPI0037E79654